MTGPTTPVLDGNAKMVEMQKADPVRETWGRKIEFLLAVVGFAVDLGNVWRFPYICYQYGGGAFLIPYLIMLIFGGLPLFYMELALGQFQKCGCLTVWNRICPAFKGIGFGIVLIASVVSWYYNTIIAWSVFYFFSAMRSEVPWKSCDNPWNTPDNCVPYKFNKGNADLQFCRAAMNRTEFGDLKSNFTESINTLNGTNITIIERCWNQTDMTNSMQTATEEFFEREVLKLQNADGLQFVGGVNGFLALCLLGVFVIVYFAMWKGVKSSGKAVWITATMPYVVLLILLVRGCMLEGSMKGIKFYLTPVWSKMGEVDIWIAAAAQVFFSLGPGFGVLLALSSYNKFNNNCYRDALITSSINCFTSFLAGFAVFAVLGHMAQKRNIDDIGKVARNDVGLIFIVYPEAISTLNVSPLWAMLFFSMLITLGLDTTFGGLEAVCTGILDEWPHLRKHRKLFVLCLMIYCFLGALSTTTYGGIYVVQLLDSFGAPIAIIFIVFLEAVAVSWIYGVERFCDDIQTMVGFRPGVFWRLCWQWISPIFLLTLFIMSLIGHVPQTYDNYEFPPWSVAVGWLIVVTILSCIPAYFIYRVIFKSSGSVLQRFRSVIIPIEVPDHGYMEPVPL